MIITTWNIRHGGGKRTKEIDSVIKDNMNSDVFILTEFRNNDNKEIIKKSFNLYGFTNVFVTSSDKKTNSILIASKEEYKAEFFDSLKDHKQRVVKIKSSKLSIYGCYFPQQKLKKDVFGFLLKELVKNKDENIIIAGDLNTGKHYIDEKGASFYCSEYLYELEKEGMVDAWRLINGNKKEYSWYSSAGNGFRIDHFFVTNSLKNSVAECFYNHSYRENKFSDHSLMSLKLKQL
mgnify:FL=1